MSNDFNPPYGQPEQVAPGLRRIVAPNPSPMTFRGTNTYLLGSRDLAIIDPGPDDAVHLSAILEACTQGQRVSHILVTHSHLDHSPLSKALSQATGAPVLAFGSTGAGRSPIMQELAKQGLAGGGEGLDHDFHPDIQLSEGDTIQTADWSLGVIHTPGHLGNHISLAWKDCCFTGDHVMGWSTSLVSPPDGDLTDFMQSCRKLSTQPWHRFFPGHGAPIEAPKERLDWLISHRLQRENACLRTLESQPCTARAITAQIYHDINPSLLHVAERNVLAHLIDLMGKNRVTALTPLGSDTVFGLVEASPPDDDN